MNKHEDDSLSWRQAGSAVPQAGTIAAEGD